ncbi:MAG: SMC-Scp complex subunit ScpB [Syntrophomonadaceae bacterium]|nr:SMC-Scp complex subunit ScpB [Syntrophomonadaceae bacterium]
MLLRDDLKGAIEAVLFVAGEHISRIELQELLGLGSNELEEIIQEMMAEYEKSSRGIQILAVEDCFVMATKAEFSEVVVKVLKPASRRLSPAALETLAIIAYRQPLSRPEIEQMRGVKSERVIANLLEKGIIKEVGRKPGIGKPILYGTTHEFLRLFGLTSLTELPVLEEKGEN